MKKLWKLRTSIKVFVVFAGVAAFEVYRTRHWMAAFFWIAIAVVFLIADNVKPAKLKSQLFTEDE
jgi:hypothetical protein